MPSVVSCSFLSTFVSGVLVLLGLGILVPEGLVRPTLLASGVLVLPGLGILVPDGLTLLASGVRALDELALSAPGILVLEGLS